MSLTAHKISSVLGHRRRRIRKNAIIESVHQIDEVSVAVVVPDAAASIGMKAEEGTGTLIGRVVRHHLVVTKSTDVADGTVITVGHTTVTPAAGPGLDHRGLAGTGTIRTAAGVLAHAEGSRPNHNSIFRNGTANKSLTCNCSSSRRYRETLSAGFRRRSWSAG